MTSNRICSIDIMRGIAILLMLFISDLNLSMAPSWLGQMKADIDGMGLADWIFPGFLFIVGISIPFSISKRISSGIEVRDLSRHIIIRWISLIIIGVLILNSNRVDAELTGINKNLWAVLMYLGIFLIWNDYQDKENNFFTITTLKLLGIAILVFLIMKFKSGQPENNGSLITSWWGYLGVIAWGYVIGAFTFLICRNSIFFTSIITSAFLILNILSGLDILNISGIPGMLFGTILQGAVPFIVLSGLITGLIIKKKDDLSTLSTLIILNSLALFYLSAGFIMRKWFIISMINATPSWGLICIGISILIFTLLYWIFNILHTKTKIDFLRNAGVYSLTAYLISQLIYSLILLSGLPVLFYKQSSSSIITIAGSLIWSLLIICIAFGLNRMRIKIKV